jgi:hypothetical protein
MRRFLISSTLALALALAPEGRAQAGCPAAPGAVAGIESFVSTYELLYLSDFVDPITFEVRPGLGRTLFQVCAGEQPVDVVVFLQTYITLDDEPEDILFEQVTDPIMLAAGEVRVFEGTDLVGNGDSRDNEPLLERLIERGLTVPTAPVGRYRTVATLLSADVTTVEEAEVEPPLTNPDGGVIQTESEIDIDFSATAEAQTELLSPPDGAALPTTQPLLVWLSTGAGGAVPSDEGCVRLDEPGCVRVAVYRREPYHRSPEEAVDGVPYLDQTLADTGALIYDAAAGRPLSSGTYFWFVERLVQTTRGPAPVRSEVRSFQVAEGSASPEYLLGLLYQLGPGVAEALDQLTADGWRPDGQLLLDGRVLAPETLPELVERLGRAGFDVEGRAAQPESATGR